MAAVRGHAPLVLSLLVSVPCAVLSARHRGSEALLSAASEGINATSAVPWSLSDCNEIKGHVACALKPHCEWNDGSERCWWKCGWCCKNSKSCPETDWFTCAC
mmetsp:Transcript_50317/g.140467  ORF Transcript_50317/g.140467 Transcript_50317/m.140467 type:complete len:103 (+) Transcript_50317:1-309(+)